MAKIDSELVKLVLNKINLPDEKRREILVELSAAAVADARAAAESKTPALKKRFAVVISDPDGKYRSQGDCVAWVVQIPDDSDAGATLENVAAAAYDFNRTRKGRRFPIRLFREAFEFIAAKIFKANNVFVKTKEPVRVLFADSKIPTSES